MVLTFIQNKKYMAVESHLLLNTCGAVPNYPYMFSYLKQKRLKYLSSMPNCIKVFHVKVPWNMERLDEVYAIIFEYNKGLM